MARVLALIKGPVLQWARESAGFTEAAAAARLEIDEAVYVAWEAEQASPSIPQLRRVAALFGRPLAVFYLQTPPTRFDVLRDLRRLPGTGVRQLPPGIMREVLAAEQHRELALELAGDLGEDIASFREAASVRDDPEDVGTSIRSFLGVTGSIQLKWKDADGRVSFNAWRSRIEAAGVLVFQATRFTSEEASGFAISKNSLPIIVVNRADAPTRRTFSMLHELVHLMIRVSGVSDLDTDFRRPPEDQIIEVFCNQAAAAALMPRSAILSLPGVVAKGAHSEAWSDAEIADLARSFGVSREALVRRLLTFNRTTEDFYRRKRGQYLAEQAASRAKMRADAQASDGIPRNMPQETISNLGRPLVRMVLGNYHQDRLTLSEVSGYLGLKTKHIPKLEQVAGLR